MAGSVKVYVKSEKIAVGVTEIRDRVATGMDTGTVENVRQAIQYDYVVPDEQRALALMVQEICKSRGYSSETIDASKEGIISKAMEAGLREGESYPLVIGPEGRRLSPPHLDVHSLEEMLPADLNGLEIRAFVRLKVKKGNEQVLIEKLLERKEVREAHLIPGEWDAFVVLGLPPATGSSERAVLDYVLRNLRSLEWVQETSTLVPLYAYTKYPLTSKIYSPHK